MERRADRSEFTELARSCLRAAYAGALAIVRRPADAEDVAQESLLAAFEKLESCRDPDRFRAWLLQIVRNRALNWLERRRLRDVPADEPAPAVDLQPVSLPDAGLRERLSRAMAQLSPPQRLVVLLHDTEGWTHKESAEHLRISVLMSRKHLFQARATLRALLAADRPEDLPEAPFAPTATLDRPARMPTPAAAPAGNRSRRGNAAPGSLVFHPQRSAPRGHRRVRNRAATG
jgi:RNA polymerase sigma-70 factor (ECF subfamily)